MSRFALLAAMLSLALAGCRASCARVCCLQAAVVRPLAAPPATPAPTASVAVVVPAAPPAAEYDREIWEHLRDKRVMNLSLSDETTISDVVSYLRTVTGTNFYVSAKVMAAKEDARIPLTVDNVSVADILDIITSQNKLLWEVRDGLVRIVLPQEADGSALLRYYDILDLIDEPEEDKPLATAETLRTPRMDEPMLPPRPLTKMETLKVTIRTLIAPASWDKERWTLESRRGVLIVSASPAVLEEIQRYLDTLRAAPAGG